MRVWTVHVREGHEPVLVRDGFCWGAAIFGPFWLMARGAWLWAIPVLVISVLAAPLPPADLFLAVLWGLTGRDMWRASLRRRGYTLTQVVAAHDEDSAVQRLLDRGTPALAGAPA